MSRDDERAISRRGGVAADDEEDAMIYTVVVNYEEQFSIWPSHKPMPRGWRSAGKEARKAECLRYIDEVWTDMRPRSLRRKMGSRGGGPPTESDRDPSSS